MKKNFSARAGLKVLFGILLAAFCMPLTTVSYAQSHSEYIQNNADGSQTLTGHVPGVLKHHQASLLRHHESLNVNAQIIMPIQNQAELNALIQGQYDPKSPSFHHWLTPTGFAQQFNVSIIDFIQVQEFLNKYGIFVIGRSPNGAVLNVTGSVRAFENAFGIQINDYQKNDDGTLFFAPNAEPNIPATISGKVLAIGGLDNLPKYKGHRHQNAVAMPKAVGSGPGGYLAPKDVKTAYNLTSLPTTGTSQTVALFELDGYASKDITAYETQFGVPSVPLQNVLLDGFNGTPNYTTGGADEVTLDIELVAAFAPASTSVMVYEAPNTTQSWIDEWTRIATDNKAKVISCSWGEPEQDSPTLSFDNQIFAQMAAQGQAVFVAAGDDGAYDAGGTTVAVDEPGSQPNATDVGISTLTTASGAYSSETASTSGGGGISAHWAIPAYQITLAAQAVKAAKVSTTMRNVPDVVLTSSASTPYSFYINGSWSGWWGSSIAAPVWASFMAHVNQGLGVNAPIGSVNTALYQLAQGSNSANDFHDITTGTNGYYPAEPGFDDATGLGSFNGLNLYNDLIKAAMATVTPSVPTALSATAGNAQVSLSWNASSGATSYDVKRATVSGGAYTTIASSVLNLTYTDSGLTNGTTYYYVVSAVNTAGQSANSAQVSAAPVLPLPSAPVGLSAVAGNAQVALSWTAVTGAASYNVKRSIISGGTYTTIATSVTSIPYTDKTASNGTTYYYVVSAVNAAGQGANSAQVCATPSGTTAVTAPSNLTASVLVQTDILLQWTQSSSANVKTNVIYYSVGSGNTSYSELGAMSAGTSASISGASAGVTYNFYITAINASGVASPASNKVSIVLPSSSTKKG